MKLKIKEHLFLLGALVLMSPHVEAAEKDSVAMRVGGRPVEIGELRYNYLHFSSTETDSRKKVASFVALYARMKQKALAALDRKLDTVPAFRNALRLKKEELLRPCLLTSSDREKVAKEIYDLSHRLAGSDSIVKVKVILRYLPQSATPAMVQKERACIDSIYAQLRKGGDFTALAKRYSQDSLAGEDGTWPLILPAMTWPDVEKVALNLKQGEISTPFLSVRGYYVLKSEGVYPFPSFEQVKPFLLKELEANGTFVKWINHGKLLSENQILQTYPMLVYKLQQYKDGMLSSLYEERDGKADLEADYPVLFNEKVIRKIETTK